ncbi:wiskott-Aldrich syndrome protein family member 3-like [Pollicipes pollicipes]|uniref:wiskott-Aldrich syndrome protein family member 3-like n=1 Tax=Pollicipes pollicipes TaxID=41117 RepID=UPI001884A83C|nr:wiskott-Aldrich syndrome protein family member 3-like [Pollicipes pollicipes]
MPFQKRLVEPSAVCRGTLPADTTLPSELEAVTNGTLSNVVRQLSSLSRHAEDMFGELFREAERIVHRSNGLQLRIDSLADKVTRLDSTVEEVSLQDIHMRKAFRSRVVYDQEVFSRESMPAAMRETYLSCDAPPPLDKLNVFREDGKDGMQFYTDPNYFFELWRQEMLKENDRLMHEKGKKPHRPRQDGSGGGGAGRHKKRVRQAQNTRQKHVQMALEQGEYITNSPGKHNGQQQTQYGDGGGSPLGAPQPRPAGGGGPAEPGSLGSPAGRALSRIVSSRPSQPPPAPPSHEGTPTRGRLYSGREALPPPPPPPPPPMPDGLTNGLRSPPAPNGELAGQTMNTSSSSSPSRSEVVDGSAPALLPTPAKEPPPYDARSDLLKAIRDGIKLRKVEVVEEKRREEAKPLHDVASILARRVAIEVSDSNSGSDSDSEAWDDETSA